MEDGVSTRHLFGKLYFRAVKEQAQYLPSAKNSQYVKHSDVDRFNIGKYANRNGPTIKVRKCSSKFTALNESIVRNFIKCIEKKYKI